MYYDITGIILAGGKSTRMGENKALLEINGITVIEHIKNLMTPIFNKLILILKVTSVPLPISDSTFISPSSFSHILFDKNNPSFSPP